MTEKKNCNKCELYGECDHQGAYQKNGKWCYEQSGGEKSQFVQDIEKFQDSLNGRSKHPELEKISIQGLVVFKLKRFSKETTPKDVWSIYKNEVDKLNDDI